MFWLLAAAYGADWTLPRVTDAAVVVDGRATEEVWARALVLPDATVFRPSDDLPAVGSMKVMLVADDSALYVHFTVTDPEPSLVRAGLGRRDGREVDDAVGLFLDPAGDGRRAYGIFATALGVQGDCLHLAGGEEDWSWDADWRSSGHRTDTGYEVEFAIPWAAIHFSGEVQRFGLVVERELARKGQSYAWPAVTTGSDVLLTAAHIAGPGKLPRRIGLELRPELTGAWSHPHTESGRLEWKGIGPGLTLRYAPSTAFGALATFNPDFSQLESDATKIDVNQRYALDYDEKRPFFLEGQEWFEHPIGGMIYTRSMNAPLYGARVAGEVGRVGYAALHVMDLSPPSSVNEGGGWTEDQLRGHAALSTLGRLRLNLGQDSYVGMLASDRSVMDTGLYNRILGVDSVVRLEKRASVEAAALGSMTTLESGAAPVLAPAGKLGMTFTGEKLFLHTTATAITRNFRQENGFLTHSDLVGALTEDHYNVFPSVDWLARISVEPVDVWSYWSFDGHLRERGWDPSVWAQFGNGAFVKVDGRFAGEEFAGTWVDFSNVDLYTYSSFGSLLEAEVGGTVGTAPFYDPSSPRAGNFQSAWVSLNLQPVSNFRFGLSPGLNHMTEINGDPLFLAWTGRAKAELFFTRSLWLRTVGEVVGEGKELTSWRVEPLAAWEWTPGRAAYLGGSYGVDGTPTWQVYAKVGWVFQL